MTALSLAQSAPGRWVARAACSSHPELSWFPEPHPTSTFKARVDAAKAVCKGCPVREECLDYAVDADEIVGIWGGLDEAERGHTRRGRQQRPIRHGSRSGYIVHKRRGELPCDQCRGANSEYILRYRAGVR